jgi:hypothetical protein
MPSPGPFEANGVAGGSWDSQQPAFGSQPSTLAQTNGQDDAMDQSTLPPSGINEQENQRDEIGDPLEELQPKDWEELEARYERDMEAAIQHEQAIMDEIEWVAKVADTQVHGALHCS